MVLAPAMNHLHHTACQALGLVRVLLHIAGSSRFIDEGAFTPFKFSLPAAATLARAVAASPAVLAKPFKWSGSSDIQTRDIQSQDSALGNGIHAAMYQSLVMFNNRMLRVGPLLAT